jgi:prevent-host-death family protein
VKRIGAYEAKTHLPSLLERVEKGERFVITRHGRAIAELVPVTEHDIEAVRQALSELHAIRTQLAKRGVRMRDVVGKNARARDWLHEGHRF